MESRRPSSSPWPWLFVILSAINAVGVTLAVDARWGNLHFPCVLGASTCFVLVPIVGGALDSTYGRFIVAALAAFWCGDVLGGGHFYTGVLAFCLGHAAFVGAFLTKGISWKRAVAALPPVVIMLVIILRWLLPHVTQVIDIITVCVYGTVISVTVLAAFGASEGLAGRLILAGALTIYLSDTFVARWRYVDFEPINGFLCYPLYYSACLMLGMTVVVRRREQVCRSDESAAYEEHIAPGQRVSRG